jgi:hypothetical protein
VITLKEVPTTVALLEPESPELSPLLVEDEEEGDDPAAVPLGEEPVVEEGEEETKGFESEERTADVRSKSNWRMLFAPCCVIVADVLWLLSAEPTFQAQIHGELLEDFEESSLHVVPVYQSQLCASSASGGELERTMHIGNHLPVHDPTTC